MIEKYNSMNLILRIFIGLVCGTVLALVVPQFHFLSLFGDLFVGSLKGIAPILVFVLVASALATSNSSVDSRFGTVIFLYMLSTFLAAVTAVVGSFLFPQTMVFTEVVLDSTPPGGVAEVLTNVLRNIVSNPITALSSANYMGILFWAILFGLAMKKLGTANSKEFLNNISDGVSQVVRWIINLAPFGIMGLAFATVSENGLSIFTTYGSLLALLVGCMLVVALIIDPFVSFLFLRVNPYPLVFKCLRESGITAFFTRSSAANIPINMALCERLGLDKEMYSVSIPLGATINMDGAAITITVMTLAAAHTLGMNVDFATALILSVMATLAACGASGVAGGSLLLIPMACSLFGIPADIAIQVVGVGFIIGIVQDSVETALNSSGDVMFAATAEYHQWLKEGKELPEFLAKKKK